MAKTATSKSRQIVEELNGLKDVPLNVLGLSIESIEASDKHIRIPKELIPYIKFCKHPKIIRDYKAEQIARYRLKQDLKKRKSPRKGDEK